MTAFYTFRMIFMTFWGEWRGPKAVWDHVHESAPTMVAPLVILVGADDLRRPPARHPARGRRHPHLARGGLPRSRGGRRRRPARLDRGRASTTASSSSASAACCSASARSVAVARGLAGVSLVRRATPEAPARFVERIPFGLGPGMYRASVNKYYVDDIYGLVFARGGVLLGRTRCGGSTRRSSTAS